jgi:NAD(P)-dependent dehydrogenase (short-subunit alcohol dehydrogenase family)
MELHGKVALVTGNSRCLGKAIALQLAGLGSKVAVNYANWQVFRPVRQPAVLRDRLSP